MTAPDENDVLADELDGEFDETIHPLVETRAHWSLFLPSLIVALIYGLAWLMLAMVGQGGGGLAKIMFLVLVIAPPVLLAHAFLRYKSAGLALTNRHVLVAKGWPRMEGQQFLIEDIARIGFRSTPVGRWLGVGKVTLILNNGRAVSVSDLADPQVICNAIQSRIESFNS